jgi:amidase
LERACAVLEKAGHTVVRLPSDASRSVALGASIAFQYFGMGSPSLSALEEEIGEPLVSSVAKGVHPFHSIPPPVCEKLGALEKFSAWGFARNAYADSWRRTWVEHNLHVLLAPGAISTAVPHDTYGNPVYTLIWNLLDVSKTLPAPISTYSYSSLTCCPVSCCHHAIRHIILPQGLRI